MANHPTDNNQRPTVSEQLIDATKLKSATINANPFGKAVFEWQNGRLVWSEVTIKDKHA